MAYVISNSPYALFPNLSDQPIANSWWRYNANSGEAITDVRAAGFFTNAADPTVGGNPTGGNINMQVGDIVLVVLSTGAAYWNIVSAISTTTGAATVIAFSGLS